MTFDSDKEAILTNIEFLSAHDGPGVRTSIFFKGCALQCKWCHNPETIHPYIELEWKKQLCIGCHNCVDICPANAICLQRPLVIDTHRCTRCFDCADQCPAHALKTVGKRYTADEVEHQVMSEMELIQAMGGGVTFSGGEPALHAKFIANLGQRLKAQGVHTALDTCGFVPWENYEKVLPYIDLVLFDLKEMDPEKHKRFTGQDNKVIHDNFAKIISYIHSGKCSSKIWIRTPLIPGYTATKENVQAIGAYLTPVSADIERWELCAFNNLCKAKYERLSRPWDLASTPLMSAPSLQELLQTAQQSAPGISISASGLTKK